jgi:galactokinase
MSEEELIEAQIAVSNKREEAATKYRDEGLEIQEALDRLQVRKKLDNLNDAEKAALREMLAEDDQDNG